VNKTAAVTEKHSMFEARAVVRFFKAEGVSEGNSLQISECLQPESFSQKVASLCAVQKI
jgi:hypothetical protein